MERSVMTVNDQELANALPADGDERARIVVKAAESFNYAAWQNATPLLLGLSIENRSDETLESLVIEATSALGFIHDKRWILDRLQAGATYELRDDLRLGVDPAFLNRLNEAERDVLTFQLTQGGRVLATCRHDIRVLARDEWGGMTEMGGLLPAFVTPNDPAIAPLLQAAAKVLESGGYPSGLDGYQSEEPTRTYLLAASLWSAIAERMLTYANPPASFEQVGQKVRRVVTILSDGLATCLDTSLLFASGLEAMGLNPVIVMTRGHCFVGVWLVKRNFPSSIVSECSELRKAIDLGELIAFETTLVTRAPPPTFPAAVDVARNSVGIDREDEFAGVIDIARARMLGVRPLASHEAEHARDPAGVTQGTVSPSVGLPLPESLPPSVYRTDASDERPRTPEGRMARWQRKLLDLSLRNRLLNFRDTKQTLPILCTDASRLEDQLEGHRLRVMSVHEEHAFLERGTASGNGGNRRRSRPETELLATSREFAR